MRRVLALLLMLVLSGVPGDTTPEAGAAERAQGWLITRTGRGPALLKGWFTANADSGESTAILVAIEGKGRNRRIGGAFTHGRIDWGVDGWPRVYGGLQPDCVAVCGMPGGNPFTFGFSSNDRLLDGTVLVATWDMADSSITIDTPGWRVRPWKPTMRVVASDEAGDVGVRSSTTSVGRFSNAEAPGGRQGSLGWVRLPCGTEGSGSAEFTGDWRPERLDCEHNTSGLGNRPGPTHWRLRGDAFGVGTVVNVLVVVDFPPER